MDQLRQQSLLKFTAGEDFDTALQARWLNMTQLVASGSIAGPESPLSSGKYPNLTATIDPKIVELNRWSGKLYGLPQMNSVARFHHFAIRQDLADKYGMASIATSPAWRSSGTTSSRRKRASPRSGQLQHAQTAGRVAPGRLAQPLRCGRTPT